MNLNLLNLMKPNKPMNLIVAATAAIFVFAGQARATIVEEGRELPTDESYYTLDAPVIELVSEGQAEENLLAPLDKLSVKTLATDESLNGVLSGLKETDLILDQIINMGKKVWTIVEANRPVVSVETDSASALPEGTRAWQSLAGWNAPQSRVYHVTYKNLWGIKVVDFSYRVLFTSGGNVNGKGAYLTQITVLPAELDVLWGFKFNMAASVPSVTNAGTSESPIGAAQVQLSWKVDTALKHTQSTQSFYVRGDGEFQDLSNGNR